MGAGGLPRISRRQFLKISAVAAGVLAGGRWLRSEEAVTLQETRLLMGTVVNLALVADEEKEGRRAIAATFAEMERLIRLFDHRQATGPLGQLNQTGRLDSAPAELRDLLAEAVAYGELTGGAFDVTVNRLLQETVRGKRRERQPVDYRAIWLEGDCIRLAQPGMSVTLDGIAKGRVVDGATATLAALGYEHLLVEAGGDLLARGQRDGGEGWRVGIAHPRADRPGALLARLALAGQALATSGDYMNSFTSDYSEHHIVDPRTGHSPEELASVTVVAPTATAADALSTAVMVLGLEAGLALLERLPHVAALLVSKDMEIHRSGELPLAG